jgi:hypothetical protein
LTIETPDDVCDPWELLRARSDSDGRIVLGDRDSCSIHEIVQVTLVEPQPIKGPGFERGLQDEDVATALEENKPPPGSAR